MSESCCHCEDCFLEMLRSDRAGISFLTGMCSAVQTQEHYASALERATGKSAQRISLGCVSARLQSQPVCSGMAPQRWSKRFVQPPNQRGQAVWSAGQSKQGHSGRCGGLLIHLPSALAFSCPLLPQLSPPCLLSLSYLSASSGGHIVFANMPIRR